MSKISLNMLMLNLANLLSVLYLIGTSLRGRFEKGEENRGNRVRAGKDDEEVLVFKEDSSLLCLLLFITKRGKNPCT